MPTYEYVCQSCGREFEAFQRMTEAPLSACPCEKQQPVQRRIGRGAGIIFKGGGFYETDFKDKKGPKPDDSSASSAKKESADAKPAPEKPAATSEAPSSPKKEAPPAASKE